MQFIKPLDQKLLTTIFENHHTIITIEDGTIVGGFGSAITEFAAHNSFKNKLKLLGIPDKFIEHGTVHELYNSTGLSSSHIKKTIASFL